MTSTTATGASVRAHAADVPLAARLRAVAVPWLFLLPCLILFVIFRVYPFVNGLYLSFTDARLGATESEFVGFDNYVHLTEDARFQVSLVNTAVYTFVSLLPILGLPLVVAVILDRGIPLRNFLRSAFFFPFTLSVVTVGITWLWLLDPVVGPFNYTLKQLGIPARPWLGDPSTAMGAIIATSVWWVTGYYLVLYLAALQDIPNYLYEAAAIDGAGPWRRFWSISLPLLRPIILLVVVLHIIGSFQLFGQVYVLTQGGPANATRTVVQTLYETGFKDLFDFGAASAMSWVLFAIILVVSLVQFRLLRGNAEG
jgi:multiple sugar transport system permease protein